MLGDLWLLDNLKNESEDQGYLRIHGLDSELGLVRKVMDEGIELTLGYGGTEMTVRSLSSKRSFSLVRHCWRKSKNVIQDIVTHAAVVFLWQDFHGG